MRDKPVKKDEKIVSFLVYQNYETKLENLIVTQDVLFITLVW